MREKHEPGGHLLDYLTKATGCLYLSDLRQLTAADCSQMEAVVMKLSVHDADLQEWNDALHYVTGKPPVESGKRARSQLLKWLRQRGTQFEET